MDTNKRKTRNHLILCIHFNRSHLLLCVPDLSCLSPFNNKVFSRAGRTFIRFTTFYGFAFHSLHLIWSCYRGSGRAGRKGKWDTGRQCREGPQEKLNHCNLPFPDLHSGPVSLFSASGPQCHVEMKPWCVLPSHRH